MGSSFTPVFKALFSGALVEQVIATVQNNQSAAIAAYGSQSPYGVLDQIVDFHKGKVGAPQVPCLTVVAGDMEFDVENQSIIRKYKVTVVVHLDISYPDPEQTADWSYHYARLLDQIFTTATYRLTSSQVWETSQAIAWPNGTPSRQTAAFAQGSVKLMLISPAHIGLVPGDESATPVHRISLALQFEVEER